MGNGAITVTREQILAFRRRVGSLGSRLPPGPDSVGVAARAGLQDSMPRAAVLSLNARIEGVASDAWEQPPLIQVWGPRFSVFAVTANDRAVFTLGRFPDDANGQRRATTLADQLTTLLDGRSMPFGEAGKALGGHPNRLRYATTTGRIVLRWDGARQPTITAVPAPAIDPVDARSELVRRYLHVFGPASAEAFSDWAGVKTSSAIDRFERLMTELIPVTTPIGDAWILTSDEQALRAEPEPAIGVRLLPSGDAYFLLQGAERQLLVPDADLRELLWTSRVWPGAILADGEIVGTWRRAKHQVTISAWGTLLGVVGDQIVAEAEALPIPENQGQMTVLWAR